MIFRWDLHLRRIVIFLWAGAMVIVVAFLYLTRYLGKATFCLQTDAYGGICHAWQNPNLLEPGGGNPYRVAICT